MAEEHEEEEEHFSAKVIGSAIFGIVSLLIAVTITFEAIQDRFVNRSPKYMRPMVRTSDCMYLSSLSFYALSRQVASLFREMTVLGFLSITLFLIEVAGLLPRISQDVFNHSEEGKDRLKEVFEEVHYLLFAVMVLFICQVLVLLWMALRVVNLWRRMNTESQNPTDVQKWGIAYLEQDPNALLNRCFFQRSSAETFFEFYSLRKEFIQNRQPFHPFDFAEQSKQLPIHFDYAEYLAICFGNFLSQIIELPPSCWIVVWFTVAIFYCYWLIVDGDLELFAVGVVVFGLMDLVALIKLQQKCNCILKKLCNPADFPKKYQLHDFRVDVKVVIAANRLLRHHSKRHGLGEETRTTEPLISEPLISEPDHSSLPAWTAMKPYKVPKLLKHLFDDIVPNRHFSLFWFGKPDFNIALLRFHLLIKSIYVAIVLAVIFPEALKEYGASVALIFLFCSMSIVFWEYSFVLKDLVAVMCHISYCGMLRNIPALEEVLRKQKARRAISAIMMMTSLVKHTKTENLEDMKKCIGQEDLLNGISQADINEIGSVFDMYDEDGSGEIDREELRKVMVSLGLSVSGDEFDAMFAVLDRNSDGVVSRNEFIRWHVLNREAKRSDMKIIARQMFDIFDKDGNGSIKVSELVEGLHGLKHGLSTDEIVALASELANEDGDITLHEFEGIILL